MYPSRTRVFCTHATRSAYLQRFSEALWRTRTVDPLLTIQVLTKEARVRMGHPGHENPASEADLTAET